MAEQVYRGNCHCGDYRFELTVPPITTATACTCLACKKGGYLWLVPPADTFREVRNAGELIEFESPALVHKVSRADSERRGDCSAEVANEEVVQEMYIKQNTLVLCKVCQYRNRRTYFWSYEGSVRC